MEKRRISSILSVLLVSLMGFVVVYNVTLYGIGTSPDSVVYIAAANNFLGGHGLTTSSTPELYEPLTQYPPFYPVVLAAGGWILGTPYQAARVLAGLIFGINIFLVGSILLDLVPWSAWPAYIGTALMLVAPTMLGIHVMAWSEPLFILLCLLSLIVLSGSIERQKYSWLILAGILASLALLTRFAGVALVAAGLVGIIFFSKTRRSRRLFDCLIFGSISVAPLMALLVYNQQVSGSATNRILAFHPITRAQLWQGLITVSTWLGLPAPFPAWVHLVVVAFILVLLLAFAIYTYKGGRGSTIAPRSSNFPPFLALIALFIGIYLFFLVVSISFLDANTPLDNRILSPVYVTFLILAIYLVSRFVYHRKSILWRLVLVGLVSVLFLLYAASSVQFMRASRTNGIGFSSPVWKNSALLAVIRALPLDMAIHSNVPEAINLHTGRPATRLPRVYELSAQKSNLEFESELLAVGEQMAGEHALIAYFNQPGRSDNPSLEEIEEILDLEVQTQANDGWIFELANQAGD